MMARKLPNLGKDADLKSQEVVWNFRKNPSKSTLRHTTVNLLKRGVKEGLWEAAREKGQRDGQRLPEQRAQRRAQWQLLPALRDLAAQVRTPGRHPGPWGRPRPEPVLQDREGSQAFSVNSPWAGSSLN